MSPSHVSTLVVPPEPTDHAEGSLHARVTVQSDCVVGHRAVLHPGCVIGSDGFGLAWEGGNLGGTIAGNIGGHWLKVPQVGRTLLGDDVDDRFGMFDIAHFVMSTLHEACIVV